MEKGIRAPIVTVLGHVDHGKCVSPDTLVPLSDGRILTAEDLYRKLAKRGVAERKSGGWVVFPKKTPKLFSFNYESVVLEPILAVWKLPSPKYLYETTLASGDKLITTPEHPYFVFTPKGQIIEKRADNLIPGECVLVPKNLHFGSSLIELKKNLITNLKNSENWVVFLNKVQSKKLLQEMKKFGYSALLKTGLITTRFDRVSQEKIRLRVKDFFNLIDRFNFSLLEAYKMIAYIKNATPKWRAGHTSHKIRLPQNSSDFRKLGYILGCLIGDGFIPEAVLDNNDKEIQEVYSSYMEEVFEVKAKIVRGHTCERVITTGGKTLVRLLIELLGLPMFDKSAKVSIPQLIQSYQPMIRSLIEGWFDTDGYVSSINHCVEFTSKSEILVRQVGVCLLGYGIHSVIYQKNGFWYLRIANKPYLGLFARNFSPRLKRKRERIIDAITKSSTSRVFDITPLNGSFIRDIIYSNEKIPYFNRYKEYKNLSRPFIKKLLGLGLINSSKEFGAVVNTEASPVQIKRIKKIQSKEKWVYDFTVNKTHNFVANRIFVHNTTLLDAIRKTSVALKEAGGITQATGASVVTTKEGKKITFIDTPGHAAFAEMRSRGAKVADIAILVVSADDGVKPQTKEARELIKEAQIPVIVAITKIDLPSADIEGAKGQLEKEGLLFESRGGDTPVVSVSAKEGKGIDELLETISLVAEVHEIKGAPNGDLEAVVIESSMDKKGAFANVVVRNGTLKAGEVIQVENVKSKVRALFNNEGKSVREILPGEPAQVIGFEEIPPVGARLTKEGVGPTSFSPTKNGEKKLGKIKEGEIAVVIKARSVGSLEALLGSLPPSIVVIDSGVGNVIGSDVLAAKSSNAWIFAFEADVSSNVAKLAENEGVHIEKFEVIYKLLERLGELLKKGQVEILGKAEILATFPFNNKKVAGCKVFEGKISKNDKIVVTRGEKEIGMAKAVSMKRQKNELVEAKVGEEFGVIFEPQLDFEIGDVLVSVRK